LLCSFPKESAHSDVILSASPSILPEEELEIIVLDP
jgi:hypothetical protein